MLSFFRRHVYSPLPTDTNFSQRRKGNRRWLVPCMVALACVCLLWGSWKLLRSKPPYSPMKSYQNLGAPPLISGQQSSTSPNKRAVVTTLYSDSYAIGAAVLGHSIQQTNVTARLLLLYLEGRISKEALCVTRTAGWEPIAVPFIPPPHGGKGVFYRFSDQYTKLNIWGLDVSQGIEQAIYLDSDTLVLRDFSELFELPFNFAAVPDIYGDARGFTVNFNAGVMVFRPKEKVLEIMKQKLEIAVYPLEQAEQSFLNLFFAANAARLPYAYNANLAIKEVSPALWKGMKDEIRIIHYSLVKPFVDEFDSGAKLLTEEQQRWRIDDAAARRGGYFEEEVGWWRSAYDGMMRDVRDKIVMCRIGS